MAIRFTSYEYYKQLLANKETLEISRKGTFLGMLHVYELRMWKIWLRKENALTTSWFSRFGRWCNWSSSYRESNGGCEDPPPGAIPQPSGPSRYSQISKCSSCPAVGNKGGRHICLISRCFIDSFAARDKPSRQFHRIYWAQIFLTKSPTRVRKQRATLLSDNCDRSNIWSGWSIL